MQLRALLQVFLIVCWTWLAMRGGPMRNAFIAFAVAAVFTLLDVLGVYPEVMTGAALLAAVSGLVLMAVQARR